MSTGRDRRASVRAPSLPDHVSDDLDRLTATRADRHDDSFRTPGKVDPVAELKRPRQFRRDRAGVRSLDGDAVSLHAAADLQLVRCGSNEIFRPPIRRRRLALNRFRPVRVSARTPATAAPPHSLRRPAALLATRPVRGARRWRAALP